MAYAYLSPTIPTPSCYNLAPFSLIFSTWVGLDYCLSTYHALFYLTWPSGIFFLFPPFETLLLAALHRWDTFPMCFHGSPHPSILTTLYLNCLFNKLHVLLDCKCQEDKNQI